VLGHVKKHMVLDFGQELVYKIKPIVIRNFSSRLNISGKFLAHWKVDQLHSIGCLKINSKHVKMLKQIPKDWQHSAQEIQSWPESHHRSTEISSGDTKKVTNREPNVIKSELRSRSSLVSTRPSSPEKGCVKLKEKLPIASNLTREVVSNPKEVVSNPSVNKCAYAKVNYSQDSESDKV